MRRVMITGGLGFIGSNLVRYWFDKYPDDTVIILDAITYACNHTWTIKYANEPQNRHRFEFVYCDINNKADVRKAIRTLQPDHILHLAAESHVCRSISGPETFVQTNIMGTFNLLEAFREQWGQESGHRFLHVSTDEVYGELDPDPAKWDVMFTENTSYKPRSPYAASKASSDHLVKAWHYTYGMDTVITNCSNNYGANQHAEKLVPKAIRSAAKDTPMTIYGLGNQVRDWLHVNDHCRAIDTVFNKGTTGETYCIGGRKQMTNVDMIATIYRSVAKLLKRPIAIKYTMTNDRPTDDLRYAIDSSKIEALGWSSFPETFESKVDKTVAWYLTTMLGLTEVTDGS